MSNVTEWWELPDGTLTPTKNDTWVYRYARVKSIDGTVDYWYLEPRSTRIVSPINPQDIPKQFQLIQFLLGED